VETSRKYRIEKIESLNGVRQEARRLIMAAIPRNYVKAWPRLDLPINWRRNFYLSGGVGVGKTWALYGLIKEMAIRSTMMLRYRLFYDGENNGRVIGVGWPEAKVLSVVDFSSSLRTGKFNETADVIASVKHTRHLFIDDLGSEMRSDYTDHALFEVIDHRHNERMHTGFTSNFKINDLPYDDRIKSRIVGMVGENGFNMTGEDRRLPR